MARINNLENFLTDVASSIKTKKEYDSTTSIAAANFDTEIASINTVNNQTKTLTYENNGVFEITPDSGYTGLDAVNLTLNIPEGVDTSDATANVNDVLSPKTFYNANGKQTGTIGTVYEKSNNINEITLEIDGTLTGTLCAVDYKNNVACSYVEVGTKYTGFGFYFYKIVDGKIKASTAVYAQESSFHYESTTFSSCTFLENANSGKLALAFSWYGYSSSSGYSSGGAVSFCVLNLDTWSATVSSSNYTIGSYSSKLYLVPNRLNTFIMAYKGSSSYTYIRMLSCNVETNLVSHICYVTYSNTTGYNMYLSTYGNYLCVYPYTTNKYYNNIYFINEYSFNLIYSGGGSASHDDIINTFYFLVGDGYCCKGQDIYELSLSGIGSTIVGHSYLPLTNNYYYRGDYTYLSNKIFYDTNNKLYKFNPVTKDIEEWISAPAALNVTFNTINNVFYVITSNKKWGGYVEGESTVLRKIVRNSETYQLTTDATASSDNLLIDRTAYSFNGKIVGTMPNNGALSYTPTTSLQTIPAGYTSGGTIDTIENSQDYLDCLDITNIILGDYSDVYTELEYIETTGTQYIDTGFIDTFNTKCELLLKPTSIPSSRIGIFGADYETNIFLNYGHWQIGTTDGKEISIDNFTTILTERTPDNRIMIIDGNITTTTVGGNQNLRLWIGQGNGLNTGSVHVQFKSVKIWQDDELVRDFIPVKKKSNNEIGMYDLVSNVFYTNAGTGEFIAGPEKQSTSL